jgi:hypothetical protein
VVIASADATGILDLISKGGVIGMFVVIFWAILTKRLVPGWVYQESIEREQKWERLALTGNRLATESVITLRQVVPQEEEGHAPTP